MRSQRVFSLSAAGPRRRQQGVYALEWALAFPLFFALVYGLICYGLTFLVRESMQLAAEDAARAALRYEASRSIRLDNARNMVQHRMSWLPTSLRPTAASIEVQVCRLQNGSPCAPDLSCGSAWSERCVIKVSFSIPYRSSPIAPALPGLHLLLPEQLHARASILVDKGVW